MDHNPCNQPTVTTANPWALIGQLASTPGFVEQLQKMSVSAPAPTDQLLTTAARVVDMLTNKLAGDLVIFTRLYIYSQISTVEVKRKDTKGTPVADRYWDYCVSTFVNDMCKKPCSDPSYQ